MQLGCAEGAREELRILPVDKQEVVALWVHVVPDCCSDFATLYYTHDWEPHLEWPIVGGRAIVVL